MRPCGERIFKVFSIEWITVKVKLGNYFFSRHADAERQNDGLIIPEVEEALLSGRIIEQY
jgi:hypothetical protein